MDIKKTKKYIINLKSRTDRLELAKKEFSKWKIPFPRLFSGIKTNPGWIGCTQSHMFLVKKCIDLNEPIMVFEDDVYFTNRLKDWDKIWETAPVDWDLIFLGANHLLYKGGKLEEFSENWVKTNTSLTMHAIIWSPKGAQKFLDFSNSFEQPLHKLEVTDVTLSRFQKIANVYAIYPGLAFQRPGYSDLENTYTDYTKLIN